MEYLPHLYCISGDPLAAADGTPEWWPCPDLAAAADRLAAAGRWLPRHARRRLTLRFIPGGNTAAPGGERVFRLAHGTPGLTEFNL
jgi:hypothetical protein